MDAITMTKVGGLHRALKEIGAGASYDLTVRQLLVLLSVGSKSGPVPQQVLVDETDLYKSTISKIVAALSGMEGDVRRENGLGLLRVDLDSADLRTRLLTLTQDGDRLLTRAAKQAFR